MKKNIYIQPTVAHFTLMESIMQTEKPSTWNTPDLPGKPGPPGGSGLAPRKII